MLVMNGSSSQVGQERHAAQLQMVAATPWAVTGRIEVWALICWALSDQRAGMNRSAGLLGLEAIADGCGRAERSTLAVVEQIAALGCRVDVSGPGRDVAHPVAEAVAAMVDRSSEASLVRHYGALGIKPGGWSAPARWLVPEYWAIPDVEAEWVYAERRSGAYCPVMMVTSAEQLAHHRGVYVRWWDAVEDLAWALGSRALGFTVGEIGVAREPWVGECEK